MNILLVFTCIIINPIGLGEKFTFSEEVREKHVGFREVSPEKFVLLKQTSGEFFSESPCKRWIFSKATSQTKFISQ